MTGRDRLVLIGIVVLVLLGGVYVKVLSPERKQATKLATEVSSARASLSQAEGKLSSARGAQGKYASAYASIVALGKAVPASEEVPSLIYQLDQVSDRKDVQFSSISTTSSGSSSSSSSSSSTPSGPPSGFTQMPFTFVFEGSYPDLGHLLESLDDFTKVSASGDVQVSGRLLTVQSLKLASTAAADESAGTSTLTGTITAAAYVLPAPQGLGPAAGATPSSSSSASTTASSSGGSGSPTAPAIVKANP